MCVKGGLKQKKGQDISKMAIRNDNFTKEKDVQYRNIKKNAVGFNDNIKKNGLIFTITSGQILCWVLVMLLLDIYQVSVMHV